MKTLLTFLLSLVALTAVAHAEPSGDSNAVVSGNPSGIIDAYPDLQKFTYSEKSSKTYFGFGLSPIAIVNNKIGFAADLFQVHWIKNRWDLELFSASFGTAFGSSNGNEQFFLFRTVPKYRILKNISIGPLLGLEFVSFSGVTAQLNKNNLFAPSETFSSMGAVYGGAVCETFNFGKSSLIKINELVYKETYSYLGTNNGWTYYFNQQNLNSDPSPIQPSTVFLLEVSFLY